MFFKNSTRMAVFWALVCLEKQGHRWPGKLILIMYNPVGHALLCADIIDLNIVKGSLSIDQL